MIHLLKNKFLRVKSKKIVFIMAVIVVPLMIVLAIFFTGRTTTSYTVGLMADTPADFSSNNLVNIIPLEEAPPLSDLALGKYTAIAVQHGNRFEISTYKNETIASELKAYFENGILPDHFLAAQRGTGTNIMGFIFMIILVQGVALTIFYLEDRSNSTYKRMLSSPVGNGKYLLAQGIFTWTCLYIPTLLAVALTKLIFGVNIGFSLGMAAILLAIMTLLASSFSLFISSAVDRNTSLMATGISLVTCILAGCFQSFTTNIKLLDVICAFIPQSFFMVIADGIEQGKSLFVFTSQLLYLLLWGCALFLLGGLIAHNRVKKGKI